MSSASSGARQTSACISAASVEAAFIKISSASAEHEFDVDLLEVQPGRHLFLPGHLSHAYPRSLPRGIGRVSSSSRVAFASRHGASFPPLPSLHEHESAQEGELMLVRGRGEGRGAAGQGYFFAKLRFFRSLWRDACLFRSKTHVFRAECHVRRTLWRRG